MAFLTYDINPTLQLLAQGKASPLQGLGQGMQNFASMISQGKQMQMQQQQLEMQKQLTDLQKDEAKLNMLNQRASVEAELANDMINQFGSDPLKFQTGYPMYRKQMIEKNPEYVKFLPETTPSMDQLKAMQQRSKTFQFFSQQGLEQLKLAQKQKEAVSKAKSVPTAPLGEKAEETAKNIISKMTFKVGDQEGTAKDLLSSGDLDALISTAANRAKVGGEGANFADRLKEEATKIMSGAEEAPWYQRTFTTTEATLPTETATAGPTVAAEVKTVSEDQIKAYANTYFNDDEQKAKEYLKGQGYTF